MSPAAGPSWRTLPSVSRPTATPVPATTVQATAECVRRTRSQSRARARSALAGSGDTVALKPASSLHARGWQDAQ
eukprot:scaffold1837_cov391-Prasinococcus_capsulatus_cf.AAC.2